MKPPSIQGFLKLLWESIEFVFGNRNDSVDVPAAPKPDFVVGPITEVAKVYPTGWCEGTLEDRKAMYALALTVCKEEGLPVNGKAPWGLGDDMLATIWGESGWNSHCVNAKTKDYGLCQFSARFYLKEYDMTPQNAIDQPERCLRIMAKNFKAGRQSNWVAYASRNLRLGKLL